MRVYLSIHDCLSFLHEVMIGIHRTKNFLHGVMIGNHRILLLMLSNVPKPCIVSIFFVITVRSWLWSNGSWIYNYLCNQCISPLMLRVRISIRERCTTLCDKVCQWLVTGRWFSPSTPVCSINKTNLHNITEILLKVALTIKHTFFVITVHIQT